MVRQHVPFFNAKKMFLTVLFRAEQPAPLNILSKRFDEVVNYLTMKHFQGTTKKISLQGCAAGYPRQIWSQRLQ